MKTLILCTFFLTNSALAASSVALFVTPPETALDWSSPGSIYRTVLKNKILTDGNPLGTTIASIDCPGQKETLTIIPEDINLFGSLFFEGRGLGLLYQTYSGKLTEAAIELSGNLKDPGTRFVRVEINPGQCSRVKDFIGHFREKKIGNRFGLPHRPLMAEGASDTSFAVAIFEVAGVLSQNQREAWETGLFLPHKLSGMPLKDQYVGIFSLMGSSWGKGPDKSSVFKFWNPQNISAWVDRYPGPKAKLEQATGIEMNKSHLPAPQGSFWQQANDPEYFKKKD